MEPLTKRQATVLEMIEGFRERNGRPPTRQEMADHFGWASPNAAQDYIKVLARKGAIKWTKRKARGVCRNDAPDFPMLQAGS